MWDTGLPDGLAAVPGGLDYLDGAFNMSVTHTMQSQMTAIGLTPDDVTYLAISHLHGDHAGNANVFADATWLVQQSEYDTAFGAHPEYAGFDPEMYAALADARAEKLSGDKDVFGDGSVVILSTPGHSPGHQALFVDLPKTGPVILSGDLYHYQSNRENYCIPMVNDKAMTVQSFARIDDVLKSTGAALWIGHDLPQFQTMKLAPSYYD